MGKYTRDIEEIQQTSAFKAFGSDVMEKYERYGWAPLDEEGRFQMVQKQYLDIDRTYQREGSPNKIRHIAKNFSWALFGALLVIEDEDAGQLLVVDGAHRLRAAHLRGDVKLIPCMIYRRQGISEEARVFFEAQTVRTTMRAHDRHRAGLVAEQPVAMKAQKLVEHFGYDFVPGGTQEYTTSAISTIYRLIERDQNLAYKTFDLLAKVAQGASIKMDELKGLFYLLSMNPRTDFYDFPLNNMIRAGLTQIQSSIRKWKEAQGKGGEKQCALGMLDIINKGQGKNKIIVPV